MPSLAHAGAMPIACTKTAARAAAAPCALCHLTCCWAADGCRSASCCMRIRSASLCCCICIGREVAARLLGCCAASASCVCGSLRSFLVARVRRILFLLARCPARVGSLATVHGDDDCDCDCCLLLLRVWSDVCAVPVGSVALDRCVCRGGGERECAAEQREKEPRAGSTAANPVRPAEQRAEGGQQTRRSRHRGQVWRRRDDWTTHVIWNEEVKRRATLDECIGTATETRPHRDHPPRSRALSHRLALAHSHATQRTP